MSIATADRGPIILRTPAELQHWSDRVRGSGMTVGMVPTMGALHRGHASLMQRAREENNRTVVSIFVNPTQFAPGEDFGRYPRELEIDLQRCAAEGVNVVFAPSVADMYVRGAVTTVHVGGGLTEVLEGSYRPGHFDGVATVVTKLLAAARPDRAYFGRKDAQQCAVVRRLVLDLGLGCTVVICPLVRDPDGLALSSRNRHLSAGHRTQALAVPRALAVAAQNWRAGERSPRRLRDIVFAELAASPDLRVDYVAVVDPDTFGDAGDGCVRCEILVAARIGGTRLIDVIAPGVDDPPVVDREGSPPPGPIPGVRRGAAHRPEIKDPSCHGDPSRS
ncbi:MAG: pantoate--beta-alanine ligase [Candidatus Dormibacteria bacterium]